MLQDLKTQFLMTHACLIFAVALAVRLLHIWQLRPRPFFDTLLGDANGYDQWAQRLAAGDWIGSDVFYQAPLYPYFLGVVYAVFGRDLLIVRIIQALIGSASCVLLGLAGGALFSKRVGLIAGPRARALGAGDLLRRLAPEVGARHVLHLPVAVADRADRRPARIAGSGVLARRSALAMAALALTRENALLLIAVVIAWIIVRRASASAAHQQRCIALCGSFALGVWRVVLAPVVVAKLLPSTAAST